MIPEMMEREMRDKQPLMHLFSKYVIRPNAFDRDPFNLPKAAQVNRHYHSYGVDKRQQPQPHQQQQFPKRNNDKEPTAKQVTTAAEDDFETVEAPKKKVKKVVPVDEPLAAANADIKQRVVQPVTQPVVIDEIKKEAAKAKEEPKPKETPKVQEVVKEEVKVVEQPKAVEVKPEQPSDPKA